MKYIISMFNMLLTTVIPSIQASLNPADTYQGTIFDSKHTVPTSQMRRTPKIAPWEEDDKKTDMARSESYRAQYYADHSNPWQEFDDLTREDRA